MREFALRPPSFPVAFPFTQAGMERVLVERINVFLYESKIRPGKDEMQKTLKQEIFSCHT